MCNHQFSGLYRTPYVTASGQEGFHVCSRCTTCGVPLGKWIPHSTLKNPERLPVWQPIIPGAQVHHDA